ncbi:unnamed protein product [Polarella glacialis]|uniref:Globin domain-containing protein n=2 Tax=Polarella glacialis TaxID=89957 RepID=A0A813GJ00_POLGL|nr:unnamed protein product [Polarella glacialis]
MSEEFDQFEATEEVYEDEEGVTEDAAGDEEEEALEEEAFTGALVEVQDKTFEEIRLPADTVSEVQGTWNIFLTSASSRDAAGEALFAAIFDSAPSLQSLFKTPRPVMAMRFMGGLNNIVTNMNAPASLKICVETLGFQHLDMDVTVPRVVIFRDALVDLLEMELGGRFSSRAKSGWRSILNYVGGAYIYIRREYAGRLKIIASSWATANKKAKDLEEQDGEGAEGAEGGEDEKEDADAQDAKDAKDNMAAASKSGARASGETNFKINSMNVPTTFNEMFMFNGAVMGFGNSLWMQEVLASFDNMVSNVANSYRLQEECDTLSLCLAKYKGSINLSEFKAVMLASLRSLVPKDWNSAHEVAWTWLWENVERMLKSLIGKPAVQEKALDRFLMSMTEDSQNYLRRELFRRFFANAPSGQDYFKQSTTRLYFIADKVVEMTIEMFRDPKKMVEDISALGLRHVGYGIPTEFFAPFVSGAVEAVRTMTTDDNAEDGFRWSLSLISRILVRTINEGSTIVMKAINTNSARQLAKAVSCAPRGKRALWLLNITVGTQSISPFYWSIESGSLESAKAMLVDLLTLRADRDNYYYGFDLGFDNLFERHPNVIQRLCADAQGGQRRVNFYIKHLVQDVDGGWWMPATPRCHPVVVLFSDMVWGRLANRYFLLGKCWFLFTLTVFIVSQSILQHLNEGHQKQETRNAIVAFRCFIYVFSLGQLVRMQISSFVRDARNWGTLGGLVPVPDYLTSWKKLGFTFRNGVSFVLMFLLMFMLSQEWLLEHADDVDPASGDASHASAAASAAQRLLAGSRCRNLQIYAPTCMVAILLYWTLIIDLTVFSTRISAFVLVCGRVVSELGLFIMADFFLIVAFASAISALNHHNPDFAGIPKGMMSLTELTLGMYPTEHFAEMQETPIVLIVVSVYTILAIIFLLNLLVAQLNGAYQAVYADMVGYARLNRGTIIVETIPVISSKRWGRWLATLRLDERMEFNEGDVGLAGGVQVLEPANANPTNIDMIARFGGSTSPAMQWPEEAGGDDESDKFERLEKVILRATKKMGGRDKRGGQGSSSMGGSSSANQSNSQSGGSSEKDSGDGSD